MPPEQRSVIAAFPLAESPGPGPRRAGGRPRKGRRVLKPKPYPRGRKRWRVIVIEPQGARSVHRPSYFETEAQAWEFYRAKRLEIGGRTILANAIAEYRAAKEARGNKPASITKSVQRIERFFRGMTDTDLAELRIGHVQKLYDVSAGDEISTIHRNHTLAEAKTFLRWCDKQGLIARSVRERLDDVEPVGQAERGSKVRLRLDEIRALLGTCCDLFDADGDLGALAVLLAVRLNTRSEDVLAVRVRDVNDSGRAVYFAEAKTRSGEGYRALTCEATRQRLLQAIAGKAPDDYVFPSNRGAGPMKWRFLNRAVKRCCGEAKVREVNAKQLRASAADLRTLAGDDPIERAAAAMGHSHAARGAVARASYVSSDVAGNVDAARVNDVIGALN